MCAVALHMGRKRSEFLILGGVTLGAPLLLLSIDMRFRFWQDEFLVDCKYKNSRVCTVIVHCSRSWWYYHCEDCIPGNLHTGFRCISADFWKCSLLDQWHGRLEITHKMDSNQSGHRSSLVVAEGRIVTLWPRPHSFISIVCVRQKSWYSSHVHALPQAEDDAQIVPLNSVHCDLMQSWNPSDYYWRGYRNNSKNFRWQATCAVSKWRYFFGYHVHWPRPRWLTLWKNAHRSFYRV